MRVTGGLGYSRKILPSPPISQSYRLQSFIGTEVSTIVPVEYFVEEKKGRGKPDDSLVGPASVERGLEVRAIFTTAVEVEGMVD